MDNYDCLVRNCANRIYEIDKLKECIKLNYISLCRNKNQGGADHTKFKDYKLQSEDIKIINMAATKFLRENRIKRIPKGSNSYISAPTLEFRKSNTKYRLKSITKCRSRQNIKGKRSRRRKRSNK
jgi:hypothetical protein